MAHCVREDNFIELYEVLGNREKQDAIRAADPDVRHCRWLIDDVSACECLPESVGPEYAGSRCPNNTYAANEELWAQWRRTSEIVEAAEDVADRAALGLLPGADDITPEEFQLARLMRRRERAEEASMMSPFGTEGTESDGH